MEDKLLNYFSRIMPISTDEADAIAATMVIKHYKKGDVLLKEGQISTEAYFVLKVVLDNIL
jgi:CRP-like cAMP-binding protein